MKILIWILIALLALAILAGVAYYYLASPGAQSAPQTQPAPQTQAPMRARASTMRINAFAV